MTADGAHTAWHRLTTSPRPQVTQFHKRIHPADYSQQPSRLLSEEHGHIRVLQGARVRLELECNVPISAARLEWIDGGSADPSLALNAADHSSPLDLAADPRRAHIEFTVERDAAYRVHVLAADTAFSNAFSPSYEIRCDEDLPPALAWIRPRSQSMVVGRESILELELQVRDELPLSSLTQQLRVVPSVSAGDAVEAGALAEDTPGSVETQLELADDHGLVAWNVDLLPMQLVAGDRLALEVTALDLKGNHSTAAPLEILIAVAPSAAAETQSERMRQQVADELEALAAQLATATQEISQLKQQFDKKQQSADVAAHTRVVQRVSQTLTEALQSRSSAVLAKIESTMAETQDVVGEIELRAVASLLSKLENESSKILQAKTQALSTAATGDAASDKKQSEELRAAIQLADESLRETAELAADFRAMVSHDVVSRHVTQLSELAKTQKQLKNQFEAQQLSAEKMQRLQLVLSRQLRDVQSELRQSVGVRSETGQRLQTVADEMNWVIEQVERMQETTSPAALQQLAESVTNSTDKFRTMQHLDGGLSNTIKDARRRTEERAGAPQSAVNRLLRDLQQDREFPNQFESVAEQLANRRSLTRAGRNADHEFAADLGNARRAVSQLSQQPGLSRDAQEQQIDAIDSALTTLAANHIIQQSGDVLDSLMQTENWDLESPKSHTEQPRAWEALTFSLERAVSQLRQAELPNEIVSKLDQLRWSSATQRAGRKIQDRNWQHEKAVSAAAELEQLAVELTEVKSLLATHVSEARGKLQQLTPSIGQLVRQAAQETRKVEQQTVQLAQDIQRSQVPDPPTRMQGLEQELARLESPIGQLREALVDQADSQDLLDPLQVQMARQSDAAIDIVDRADQQTAHSLDEVQQRFDELPTRQAQLLSAAAEKQADVSSALEQLAEHFEQLQAQLDHASEATASQQLANLNEIGQELAADASALAESGDYAQAEKLSSISEASPEETLRQLERQLTRNRPMQQEMSEIASNTARRALDKLEQAAERQATLQPALENSDPSVQAKKELLAHDLQHVTQFTQNMLDTLVQEARSTAGSGQQVASEQKLRDVFDRLREVQQAATVDPGQSTLEDMRNRAAAFSQALKRAQQDLQQESRSLVEAVQNPVHKNDADLNNRQREMRDLQSRVQQLEMRHTQQVENQQRQALNRAESGLKQAEQRTRAEQQRLEQAKKQASKHESRPELQAQVVQLEQRLAIAQSQQAAREVLRDALKDRAEQVHQLRQAIDQAKPAELLSLNPSAELSSRLADKAAQRSAALAQTLADWIEPQPAAQASHAQLQSATNLEQDIGREVENAAADLARAARHEDRLGHQASSTQLGNIGQHVQQVARNELEEAREQLSVAQQDALRTESTTQQASGSTTQASQTAIATAQVAMEQAAGSLDALLNQQAAAPSQDTPSQNSSGNTTPASDAASTSLAQAENGSRGGQDSSSAASTPGLGPRQMAQLLDELDRQLNRQANLGAQDNNQAANAQANKAARPVPTTLAEAAKQLAARLSQARQPPAASSDMGLATDSSQAMVQPQAPVAVRLLQGERRDGDWGELREQSAEEMIETRRDALAPIFRRQVDAYFRALSERSQTAQETGGQGK